LATPLVLRLDAYTRLSQDDRDALAKLSKSTRDVAARRDVVREGDRPRAINLVLSGWGCRYKALPDGRRQIVGFVIPGDFCDLNSYILNEMDHSIGAITRMRIAEIAHEDLDQLTLARPRLAQALRWDQLVAESIQREWTLNVGQRTAYERIAHLLVELFLRTRAVGLTHGDSCDFPLTQIDIAEATGLTAVHVNRTLQELRKDGLVELERKKLRIPDLKRLMDAAMFNPNYLHLDHEGQRLDAPD
jgi:CRP-like cAMP-binding protein